MFETFTDRQIKIFAGISFMGDNIFPQHFFMSELNFFIKTLIFY